MGHDARLEKRHVVLHALFSVAAAAVVACWLYLAWAVGALGCGLVWGGVAWWTRPRVIKAGSALVFVQGRAIGLYRENIAGVGVIGTLGLVGGKCVGLVSETDYDGSVIVWPSGTTVSGSGSSLAITSRGVTVHIGDEIDAGTQPGLTFPEFQGRLPKECESADLMDIWLAR